MCKEVGSDKAPFGSSVFLKYSVNTSVSINTEVLNTSRRLGTMYNVVLETETQQVEKKVCCMN
jgi:hypothetical protein